MTDFVMRVTIICPEADKDDANSYAAVLGFGAGDLQTFRSPPGFEDTAGNKYHVASTLARATFPTSATSTLARPAWDVEPYQVNMTGAERAQDALVVYDPDSPVQADPSRILAIIHDDQQAALTLAGVTRIPVEGP